MRSSESMLSSSPMSSRETGEFERGDASDASELQLPTSRSTPPARRGPFAASSLASPLPGDLAADIAVRGTGRRVPANTIIAHEGESSDALCLVRRGRVRVSMMSDDGRTVVIDELGPGHYFGESVFDDAVRDTTVTTLESCDLVYLPRRQYLELLAMRSDFNKHVMVTIARRVRHLGKLVKRLALLDVNDRVRLLLTEMARRDEAGLVVSPRPSQQMIADHVGASRSMINRVVKELSAEGWLDVRDDALVIRTRESHAARAGASAYGAVSAMSE
ncbi:MAG: Crp/Fnr family transcriptional regulator [Burkholderiaceae bacterium]